MASAAYQLLKKYGFEPLDAYGWHQALRLGQIVIPDYNEQGESGPILDLILRSGRPSWKAWKSNEESNDFHPDPNHERLVIWVIENGADPWARYNGSNAWSEAVYRGWPEVMKYLAGRPDAPPKSELEQEGITPAEFNSSSPSRPQLGAPAAFAYRNQLEALQAWSDLGLSVNVGVGTDRSAGTEAKTPQFLALWAKLGGDITAPTASGKPLKTAWRSSSASWQVAMEREWLRHQPKQIRPVDECLAEAVEYARSSVVKTLFVHKLKELGVSVSTPGSDGKMLWERWWSAGTPFSSISKTTASVADLLLSCAPNEVMWDAMVEGLKKSEFPSAKQLEDLVSKGRFGSPADVIRRLATELKEYPVAMRRLFDVSRSVRTRLELMGPARCSLPEKLTYSDVIPSLANFWGEWFFTPSIDCPAGQGWKALAQWEVSGPSTEGSVDHSIYTRIMAPEAGFEERRRGAELLGVMELRRQVKLQFGLKEEVVDLWKRGSLPGWASGLDDLTPLSPTVPSEVVGLVWEQLRKDCMNKSQSLVVLGLIEAHVAEHRLQAALPSGSAPSVKPRF